MVVCDLCHKHQPCIYCSSDSAFLCFDCDLHVHSANFLVARHIRLPLCNGEQEENDQSSSSSSSDCISSTDHRSCSASKTTTKIASSTSSDWKTREVLETWCSRLGISNKVIIAEAAFQVWWVHRSRIWPYRVALAASLWLGLLRSSNNKRIRMSALLKRLEEISGVPAKSIVIAQSRLANTSKMVKHTCEEDNVEESCDEC
ncbi:B-box zinc finger protein 32 [Tanacetum coccineum]